MADSESVADLTGSLRETLSLFDPGGEPRTTTEIADELDLGRRSAYDRLDRLVEADRLETKAVGASGRVWWRAGTGVGWPGAGEGRQGAGREGSGARVRTAERSGAETSRVSGRGQVPPDGHVPDRGRAAEQRQADEQREADEQLLERYVGLVEAVGDPVYELDADGRFTFVNDALVEKIGYDRSELLGEHVSMGMDERDVERAETLIAEGLVDSAAEPVTVDYEITPKDGDPFPAETRISLLRDEEGGIRGTAGVMRDVTEQRERERHLQQYETMFQMVSDGLYVLDDESRFLAANDAFCRMTGVDREALLGEHASVVVDPATVDRIDDVVEDLESDDAVATVEEELRRPDGTTITVENRVTPYRLEGDALGRLGAVRDVTDRRQREAKLRAQVRQQEVLTHLGQRALEESDLAPLLRTVADRVAATLEAAGCRILEHDPASGSLAVREASGEPGSDSAGRNDDGTDTRIDTDGTTRAARALATADTVVEDRSTDVTTAGGEDPETRSGIGVAIGPQTDPWGVLEVQDADPVQYADTEVAFVESVATVLANAIQRLADEETLRDQRRHLATLNNLNEVARDITEAVIDRSTRTEIEQAVCDRLSAAGQYRFSWIGEVDGHTETLAVRAEAGAADYLEEITVSVDPDDERSVGATGQAFLTGTVQTAEDVLGNPDYEPWRESAKRHGVGSVTAVPIGHGGTTYGVLTVYAGRPNAFSAKERAVLGQIGEVVGHAIAAIERKRALLSDEVVELEFRVRDVFEALDRPPAGPIDIQEAVPVADGEFLAYGTVPAAARDQLQALVEALPHVSEVTVDDAGDPHRITLRFEDPPVLGVMASLGGRVGGVVFQDGDLRMEFVLPSSAEARRLVDAVLGTYPGAEMVRRRQVTRTDDPATSLGRVFGRSLTDRQEATLRAAFHAGYFDWPRGATGEDLADSLGVAPPTFHQHLRRAERKVFESVLGAAE